MAAKGDPMGADVVSKHLSTKLHTWRGKYARLWAITPTAVQNVDPSNFSITNSWPWSDVVDFAPAVSSVNDFSFTVRSGKKSEILKYSADYRAPLLCDLQRYSTGDSPATARRFMAVKITRASSRQEAVLEVGSWYVACLAPDGRRVSLYPFREITALKQLRDDPSALLVYAGNRPHLFATPERSEAMRLLSGHLTKLGMTAIISDVQPTAAEYRAERLALGNDGAPRIAEFAVLKYSAKSSVPRTRRLVVTESSVTERDSSTYAVVSSRPLGHIHSLTRHWDEPQKLTIEYRDGSARTYSTSLREALLGSLMDGARNAGNGSVCVNAEAVRPGDRLTPNTAEEDPEVAALFTAHVQRALKAGGGGGPGPYNTALVRACAELNANVSPLGLAYATKKSVVAPLLPDLLAQLLSVLAIEEFPPSIIVTLLQTLVRLVSAKEGYRIFLSMTEAVPAITAAIGHDDDGVVHWGLELLRRMCHNPRRPADADEDVEAAAKKFLLTSEMRVAVIQCLDVHAHGGSAGSGPGAAGGGNGGIGAEGTLVMLDLTALLDSVLVSHVDTTPQEAGDHMMQLTASRYFALLSLFRCHCPGIVEASALLMRTMVDQADEGTVRAMQAAAISSGVWLRHLYNAVFAPSLDQRYVSRYLVELWSTGNATAREVLRHMLPAGLLLYLEMPRLKDGEAGHLEAYEASAESASAARSRAASGVGAGAGSAGDAARSGLAQRLRQRLEAAERASHNRVKRRLGALDEHAAGARRGRRRNDPKAAANMAAAASAAVAAQAALTKAKIEGEGGREENYPILFFQLGNDHTLPDLIWNQQTRAELRAALEAELREIEREIELGAGAAAPQPAGAGITNKVAPPAGAGAAAAAAGAGAAGAASPATGAAAGAGASPAAGAGAAAAAAGAGGSGAASPAAGAGGLSSPTAGGGAVHAITGGVDKGSGPRVAWNFAEFEVEYPSLVQELKVGDYYLRLFLESGDSSVATLREPGRFFDALYRRVLRETAPNLKCMCLRGMARVYDKHWRAIGAFEDSDYMVYLLSTTMHAEVRDRLLLLLLSLAVHPHNCEKLINPDCLELLVDLLTTAHTTDVEQRAMPVLKGGQSLMLLTNAPPGYAGAGGEASAHIPSSSGGPVEEGAATPSSPPPHANPKESMKIWHYRAAKVDLVAGEKPEKGPYSLQDLARLGEMRKLGPSTLVWAQGMREWVRLDSLRAVMWFTCSEGLPALTPTLRGEACVDLLRRLVNLRPSLDAEGAPVRPVPKAKRVLCGPRTLPHIAQALLAGSPKLVDGVAGLVGDLVRHNPKAVVKLYMTGVFYFVLAYNGSNWKALGELLASTHLLQSFHADAASLTAESTLGKRSILGPLLPESMVCVLENRGHAAFADTLLSNVDTPEVIWKYAMRGHLLDMVTQHLGDLPQRLAANPCTLYDYCPIPPVRYEELDGELWCHNFYLANLCDEARFPEWPIADPVGLLRAVLDAWRAELVKGEEPVASPDEAFSVLGIPLGSDEKEIRKAYRKLAIKYHPDKNPAGRDTFEKIQKAYDSLTSGRGSALGSGSGGTGSAGPDPVSLLLLVRAQCILFARHGRLLKQYKYAGYPLVLEAMRSAGGAEERVGAGERGLFLEACTRLVYLTCLATPKNADELIRESGCEALMYTLGRAIPSVAVHPPLPAEHTVMRVTENVLHTVSGLATMKEARDRFMAQPAFPGHLATCLALAGAPKIMQHALDAVARLAVAAQLQAGLVSAGVLYRLLPLLFRYDATLEAAQDAAGTGNAAGLPTAVSPTSAAAGVYVPGAANASTALVVAGSNTSGRLPGIAPGTSMQSAEAVSNEQRAANTQAKLAVRALGRLGGYLDGELATPKDASVRRSLAALLTPPLAKRLARPNPEPLLRTLNGHEESALVVWNAGMRRELLAFVVAQLEAVNRTGAADMGPAYAMRFTATREELRLAGLYVRFYVADSGVPVEDPAALTLGALRHIAHSRAGGALPAPPPDPADPGEDGPPYPYDAVSPDLARRHLRLALRCLHLALVNCRGTEGVLAGPAAAPYLPSLFALLEQEEAAAASDTDDIAMNASGGGAGTNKAAAGSGASAGAGGAISTPAPPTASLRELILCAVAAFVPYEACAAAVAGLHLIPVLIRQLPRDSASFGPILRTLLAHSVAVGEVGRIAGMLDLLTLFAGGAASGPAPGKPGGPRAGTTQPVTVPKPARMQAAALLSIMTSDAHHGPPLLMQLNQLLPEALSVAIKESVSGATSAGTGSTGAALLGLGLGAAGAGGGTGSIGDVVSAFDADHETPELIWNAVCRHELRCALGELTGGLANLRKRAAAAGAPGGGDGCGWTMPASFRVRYSPHEGELRIGGVCVRVFLKEPTFPLRDPKGFLEALLRRFFAEAEQLCGMTSEDADKARAAMAAAGEAAKAEEAAGGVAVKTRADAAGGGSNTLVLRGEDVATQVTHAIVCLLRVRPALADAAASLGYITKAVQCCSASTGKPARYALGLQCARLLQVAANSKVCVAAAARSNVVSVLLRSMTPLHRDAAFTLETLKALLETDSKDAHVLVEQALRCEAIPFCLGVLEREKLDHLVDPSAAKVHAVAICKLLEADALHGPTAQGVLQQLHRDSWEKYRHQKHDLFLSRNDTRDYFLTDVAAGSAPTFMLKNAAEWGSGGAGAAGHGAPGGGAGGALVRMPSAGEGLSNPDLPPTLHSDSMTGPPPAPEFIAPTALKFGGFQAPAPAPAPMAAPSPAAAAPAADPFGGMAFGAAPSAASAARPAPAAAAAPYDPFSAGSGAAAASSSSAPIILGGPPAPAPQASAASYDPFALPGTASATAKPAASKDPFADLLG